MKKLSVLSFLVLFSALISGAKEKILLDYTEDGIRTVQTDFTKSDYLFYAVRANKSNADVSWAIVLRMTTFDVPITGVEKGAPLLIRLGNDEVLELNCAAKASDDVGEAASYNWRYDIYPTFYISKTDLDKIAQYGIKKVRIQLIDKDEMQSEWNFTKQKDIDKISRNFMDKIEVVEALISKSNDIREDF